MLDFIQWLVKETREGLEIRPDFMVGRSKDLMVQGGDFYAIWDEKAGLWSRDKYLVAELVDAELRVFCEEKESEGLVVKPKYLRSFANGGWKQFNTFLKSVSDNSHPLDTALTFANTKVEKTSYASRRLSYDIASGDISAYEQLISLLYAPEERQKFEWALGSIIEGKAKEIQKFLVFFGAPGTGKSTIMDIAFKILGGKISDGGYVSTFESENITGGTSAFSLEAFRDNPLLALQHDTDLSGIKNNAKLNSIVSHEEMRMNEKYKATYDWKINAQLWLGTNKPVRITDGYSGLIRRLIDVHPTGLIHDVDTYHILTERVNFELGAIAYHCAEVFRKLGKNRYSKYVPEKMIQKTNVFYNFVEFYHDEFAAEDGITLKRAFDMWKQYCKDAELEFKMAMHKFREELRIYFESFEKRITIEGTTYNSYFMGFKADKFKEPVEPDNPKKFMLVLEHDTSLLDEMYAGLPAQYAGARNNPKLYWDDSERPHPETGEMFTPRPDQICTTTLGDLDTGRLHFLKVPQNHIVIDFDLTDENGKKSPELNLEAAASWPPTYAEFSKSGGGVHLHYLYDGDASELASEFSSGIEVKVYSGNSSLRRKLSNCNNVAVATISGGHLPHKEKKDMLQGNTLKSEKGLRALILKCLRKENHGHTKPEIDFIEHILRQAYQSGMVFDISDMKPLIIAFANGSKNQSAACFRAITRMKFKSELTSEEVDQKFDEIAKNEEAREGELVFFDCEVYPNLFVVCWKYRDGDPNSCVRMINPTPQEIEKLITHFKLVGFNNRDYDNHILWARYMGYTNEQLYELSQRIIAKKDRNAKFAEAYRLSYADVYDFSVKKQGLKAWEIELGGKHMEMDIPWDQPVPQSKIMKVVEYCCNDVIELERVFEHLHGDFVARQILADLSGMPVNNTTRNHAGRIIFGEERNPQKDFVYTDLSETFPGYKFDKFAPEGQKSTYRDEFVGEGGYVYAEPGMYKNVVCLDVASMHPTSIEELHLFGPYTATYSAIKEVRLAIKAARFATSKGNFEKAAEYLDYAKKLFEGKLRGQIEEIERIEDPKERAKALKTLEEALKLVINSVYGYTSAKFENLFRDPRNIDNIVAKRGALFMIDLKHYVQELGYQVVHIKTDSIKIPNADDNIIKLVTEFGNGYGYEFEVEGKYKKLCLVNDAVYVAQDEDGSWGATGAQFQHPYVFKRLFSGEGIDFRDLCEKKQVKEGVMYLDDINLNLYGEEYVPELVELDQENKSEGELVLDYDGKRYHIGRTGLFVPVAEELGGNLIRIKDGKEFAVQGTKGYRWVEAEMLRTLKPEVMARMAFERIEDAVEGTGSIADIVNLEYFERLVEKAVVTVEKFGNFQELIGDAGTYEELDKSKLEITA